MGATSSSPARAVVWSLAMGVLVACGGSDPAIVEDPCDLRPLPLSGSAAGPVVRDVALEVQPTGLVLLLTATDPQGTDDLVDVVQTVGVYAEITCSTAPITATDDLACSACEESFGTLVPAGDPLYVAVAGASAWPVSVTISDASGNVTAGNVSARVVR